MVKLDTKLHLVQDGLAGCGRLLGFFLDEFYGVEFAVLVASGQIDFTEASDCKATVDLIIEFPGYC